MTETPTGKPTGTFAPVTDEKVETAARAIDHAYNPDRAPILAEMFRDYARAALEAVAPLIAAEALREAAEDWRRGHTFSVMEDWLCARADQVEQEATR